MSRNRTAVLAAAIALSLGFAACDEEAGVIVINPLENPEDGPPAGNLDGDCVIPAAAGLEDVSSPRTIVGDGTPASCTSEAVVDAVAAGGVIVFDCGPDPITITLEETAKVRNDTPGGEVVIDGGGLVTLSGGGERRILYMNTCDEAQVWTTSHCDNQDHPRLTVQNITFIDAVHEGSNIGDDGGAAIWTYGGRFKAVNTRFFNNHCTRDANEVGGGGIRAYAQHDGQPIYVVNSTFGGGEGYGNVCSNGGGISSIGVSWTILNSVFTHNEATASNGSGGAIYNDGGTMTLTVCGSIIEDNSAVAHGGAIFFVSNSHTGTLNVIDSTLARNADNMVWNLQPGISGHEDTDQDYGGSTIE